MAYAEEQARLAKKRQLAQALIQQGSQPQGMQAGRTFVGPTAISSLASLAGIVAGGVMDRKLEKKEKGLNEERRKQLADMLRGISGGAPSGPQGPTNARPAGMIGEEGWKGPADAEGFDIDLSRPKIDNKDGSFSTEKTITVGMDGRQYNIPTIWNGQQVSSDQAVQNARQAMQRGEKFPSFSTIPEAEQAARARSTEIGNVRSNQPAMPADPQRESMLQFLQGLPLEQQEALIGQQAMAKLFPSAKEGFTLGAGQKRYDASGKVIAEGPVDPKSLFGGVSPSDFTPESLREFQQTGDYGALKPRGGGKNIGNFNPGDYTPQSFAKFIKSNDPNDLQRYITPANPSVQIIGGVPTVVQPDRAGGAPTQAPLSTLPNEAAAKGTLAGAEAAGKASGTAVAEAKIDLPRVQANAAQTIDLLERIKTHPGLDYGVGLWSKAPVIPGTPQADFVALTEQLQGKQFLEAYQSLKGGGQITEVEGTKAENAIARMQRAQSKPAFIQAATEFQDIVRKGVERAQQKADQPEPQSQTRKTVGGKQYVQINGEWYEDDGT